MDGSVNRQVLIQLAVMIASLTVLLSQRAHAVDVTIEDYFLGISVGNGTTNEFGPSIDDLALPLDSSLQFSQAPSSAMPVFC